MKAMAYFVKTDYLQKLRSKERLNNKYRNEIRRYLDNILSRLRIIVQSLDTSKELIRNDSLVLQFYSPDFYYSCYYSFFSTALINMASLFDEKKPNISIKLVLDKIKDKKMYIETDLYQKDEDDKKWKLAQSGKLGTLIRSWNSKYKKLKNKQLTDIKNLRDKVLAHNDFNTKRSQIKNINIDDFETLTNNIHSLIDDIYSSIFYEGKVLKIEDGSDLKRTLEILNRYKAKDVK